MIPRLRCLILCLLITAGVYGAGSSEEGSETAPNTGFLQTGRPTDSLGRVLALGNSPRRIVSLSPGITETIDALGYADRLVGRSMYCDYPPELDSVPIVTSVQGPDIERIIALEPDLVVSSLDSSFAVLQPFEKAGLRVATLTGSGTLEGVYDDVIRKTAMLLGDPGSGEALIRSMEKERQAAHEIARGLLKNPTVYLVVGFSEGGDWTAGGDTVVGSIIREAGGHNIAEDIRGWSFSREALIASDPDIVLVPRWAENIFSLTPPYSALRAVKAGHVFTFDEDLLFRQGPRLVKGLAELAESFSSLP